MHILGLMILDLDEASDGISTMGMEFGATEKASSAVMWARLELCVDASFFYE